MHKKLELMASVVYGSVLKIRQDLGRNNLEALRKETVIQKAFASLPLELGRFPLTMTGDNWLWTNNVSGKAEFLYPDLSASVALTERDEEGNIISCAMAPVAEWEHHSLVADSSGIYILNLDGFFPIKAVNPILLQYPPRVYIFGQKSTLHWWAVNTLIGEMNRLGIRTQNDCGPSYGLLGWFSILREEINEGIISPRNVVYIEPYGNKPKEELMAFMVNCLNKGLKRNQFVLTTMAGGPVFEDGKFAKTSDGLYPGTGFIIAPSKEAHEIVMSVLRLAITCSRGSSLYSSPKPMTR